MALPPSQFVVLNYVLYVTITKNEKLQLVYIAFKIIQIYLCYRKCTAFGVTSCKSLKKAFNDPLSFIKTEHTRIQRFSITQGIENSNLKKSQELLYVY